jgi:peptide/nickel transport system permease protein
MSEASALAWRPAHQRPPLLVRARERVGRSRTVVAASLVVLAVLLPAAVILPWLDPTAATHADITAVYSPPSAEHLLGTDGAGRDLLVRTLAALRTSFLVGLVAAAVATLIGVTVGAVGAATVSWGRGVVDQVLMRLVDAVNAVPHLVLGVVIVAMLGPSVSSVITSIAVTHWTTPARLVRAEMLSVQGRDFVDVAIVGGAGRWRVTTRHVLPQVASRALLAAVLMVPHAIWHESALSFLGLGMPPHLPSLGAMIQDAQVAVFAGHWWPAFWPGLALVVVTLAISGAAAMLRPRERAL